MVHRNFLKVTRQLHLDVLLHFGSQALRALNDLEDALRVLKTSSALGTLRTDCC